MNIYLQILFFLGFFLVLYFKITDCTLRRRFAATFVVSGLTLTFLLPYVAIILSIQLLPSPCS